MDTGRLVTNLSETEGTRENTITAADVASAPTSAAIRVVTILSEARFWYTNHQRVRFRIAAIARSHIFEFLQFHLDGREAIGGHGLSLVDSKAV
jgi:hypothetical protein